MKVKYIRYFLIFMISFCCLNLLTSLKIVAEEDSKDNFEVSSDETVKQNEDFVTNITFRKKEYSPVIIIDNSANYVLNVEKTKNENEDLIKDIEITDKINIVLNEIKDTEKKELSVYGKYTNVGTMSKRFYFIDDYENEKKFTWNVISSISTPEDVDSSTESTIKESAVQESSSSESTMKESAVQQSAVQQSSPTEKEIEDKSPETQSSYATVSYPDNFDWSKLNNDGVNLSEYTEQDSNVPVRLSGGAFDNGARNYYLFFGHVGNTTTYDNSTDTFRRGGNMNAPLGKGLPLMSPMVIGTKKSTGTVKVFAYDYDFADNTKGATSSVIDIGLLDQDNSKIIESNYVNNTATYQSIEKLYTKDNNIIAYGFVQRKEPSSTKSDGYMAIRIHGYVVNFATGQVRYDISYLNESEEDRNYLMTYGLHVDIGGQHTNSQLYSNGENGIYFDEPDATKADGISARLYFYLGDEYYKEKNGPVSFKVGDLGRSVLGLYNIATWQNQTISQQVWSSGSAPSYLDPLGMWDSPGTKGEKYNLKHPIFAYRWNPVLVKSKEVGTNSFDLSVKEPLIIKAEKTFVNLTTIDDKNRVNDEVEFQLKVKNGGENSWTNVKVIDEIPSGIEIDDSSIEFTDSDGNSVKLPAKSFDKETRILETDNINIEASSNVMLKFRARLTKELSGKTVTNTMLASDSENEYFDTVSFIVEEVPGSLSLVSVPTQIDFGKHYISSERLEVFGDVTGTLKVYDDRKENGWVMKLTQTKEFTNGTYEIPNILSFVSDNGTSLITDSAIIIAESNKKGEVDLTDIISGENKHGIKAEVPIEYQRTGSFSGELTWTLEDVPEN